MKLLDLLKSLNSGNTTNPDAAAIGQPEHSHPERQRDELLDELSTILSLLDATPATEIHATTTNPPAPSPPIPTTKNAEQPSLLNLTAIFEEDFHTGTSAEEPTAPLLFMPAESSATASDNLKQHRDEPDNRKQLVQSLLDELLPALERALDERLRKIDADTLQRLEFIVASRVLRGSD